MENVNIAKSIKEEPFEEFLFPETIMHSAGFNLAENCCFLCEEGKEILISLKEHFQSQHPGKNFNSNFLKS